jgi:signal transduction histidine kinase
MLCFTDISQKILYDTSKAEGELLSLINSTISHEMRNPLNSIINQCIIMESLLHNLKMLKQKIRHRTSHIDKETDEEIEDFQQEFENSINIQKSSSNLLLMNVEDILGYA